MKRLGWVVAAAVLGISSVLAETLDNNSVVQMVELGLDDEIIVTKIESSNTNFDTSMNALSEMKKKGVSTRVIKAMIAAEKAQQDSANADGYFYFEVAGERKKMVPASITHEISHRKAWIPFAGGGAEDFFFFDDAEADVRFNGNRITFYTPIPPNRLILVRLGLHKGRQTRFIVFEGGSSDRQEHFSAEPTDNGQYKIVLEDLSLGEYAFMVKPDLSGSHAPMGGFGRLAAHYSPPVMAFDFAVDGTMPTARTDVSAEDSDKNNEDEED